MEMKFTMWDVLIGSRQMSINYEIHYTTYKLFINMCKP